MLNGLYPHMLNSFLLTILLIIVTRKLAGELCLLDTPDFRKKHEGMVPLCGGFAIFTAFMVSGIGFNDGFRVPWNWEIGLGMLVILGMADDRWRLPAVPRLAVQAVAAIVLISPFAGPFNLGALPGTETWVLPPLLGIALAGFFTVGTINAVNMLDGVDGLAGSSAAASLVWLALIAFHGGDSYLAVHALVLLAAVSGFLLFNLRHPWQGKASVFLGDGGSLMLGAALAFFIIRLCHGEGGIAFPILLWIVVVPVADTLSLIVRRLASRRSPLSPDRWHLHHLLLDAGLSPAVASMLISGANALCGAVAYAGVVFDIADSVMALALLVPLAAHSMVVLILRDLHAHEEFVVPSSANTAGAAYLPQAVREKP